jgi:DNA invertase Pin-like site-specific DNA recombinase
VVNHTEEVGMPLRAAIYCRISLDKQGKRAGVERQQADCQALVKSRRWSLADTYVDNDRSAYSGRERPEYERLVADIAAGAIDVVVAWHSDRLWRSVLEQQSFLVVGRDSGLKLVATPGADFDPHDADDSFMSTLLTAVAQKESADKARRMARKQTEKAERGEFHGGPRAFGHNADRTRENKKEADAIRDAAARILSGESFRSVMLSWNARGLTTTRGNPWRHDTFTVLLRQPRLAGLRDHHGTITGPATWPAIIDRETHERLAAIIDSRLRGPKLRPARKNLLTGFLRCHCGARMTAGPNERGVNRYFCPPRGNGKGEACTSVIAHHAEDAARDAIIEYLDSRDFARALQRARRAADDSERTVAKLTDRQVKDHARLAELGEMLADGEIDRAEYKRLTARVTERIDDAERKLARLDTSTPAVRLEGQGALIADAWEAMTLDERRDVIGAVAEYFTVMPAEKPVNIFRAERIKPEWRFP